MALNEDPSTWIGLPINYYSFSLKNISETDYNLLLLQASVRAKSYILNTIAVPQYVLDASVDGDNINIAFQKLSCYELLTLRIGLQADTFGFSKYSSPEKEDIEQTNESFNRLINMPSILKEEADTLLYAYSPVLQKENNKPPLTFNWDDYVV
jgi:hypothetical protein